MPKEGYDSLTIREETAKKFQKFAEKQNIGIVELFENIAVSLEMTRADSVIREILFISNLSEVEEAALTVGVWHSLVWNLEDENHEVTLLDLRRAISRISNIVEPVLEDLARKADRNDLLMNIQKTHREQTDKASEFILSRHGMAFPAIASVCSVLYDAVDHLLNSVNELHAFSKMIRRSCAS